MYSRRHFPNQKPNEHVLMFLRRHWVAVVKIIIINICLAIMPIVLYFGIAAYSDFFDKEIYKALFILLVSAFYLFVILFAFSNFVVFKSAVGFDMLGSQIGKNRRFKVNEFVTVLFNPF